MNAYQNGKKIDCHTHIFNEQIRAEYFSRTQGYAIVMQLPERILANPDCAKTVASDPRLFLCPCIDLKQPIPPQLAAIEPNLERHKIVGLKIYLTYQKGRATDDALLPAYEFAQKHGLTVTFHTGLCSLVLPSDEDMEGSDARYIGEIAQKFPDVNFVIAHMDDPRFTDCIRIVSQHENLFTDFSGAYETGTKEGGDVAAAIATFAAAIHSQPGMARKILYGTDFCPPINLGQLAEYDQSIEEIFPERDFAAIYYENCLRAFPRLKKYLKESELL